MAGMADTKRTLRLDFNDRDVFAAPLTDGQVMVLSSLRSEGIGSEELSDLLDILKPSIGDVEWKLIKRDLISGSATAHDLMALVAKIAEAPKPKPVVIESLSADPDDEIAAAEAHLRTLMAARGPLESNG